MVVDASRVFADISRVDFSPRRHAESRFAFLNRVGGAFWDQVRELVEDWFAQLTVSARADVGARLRSSDDRQGHGAFWELYLHEAFRRSGYDVTIHPAVCAGPRQPDFLVRNGDVKFYLEATTVFEQLATPGIAARQNRLYDEINKLDYPDYPDFFVSVEIRSHGARDPRGRQLRKGLREWLDGLNPDAKISPSGLTDDRNVWVWSSEGWEIEFRPCPVTPDARGRADKRLIGAHSGGAALVTDCAKLRRAIAGKGSAYGDLAHPLVVAVNLCTHSSDNFDVLNALYDRLQVSFDTACPDAPGTSVRAPDGYWAAKPWQHQHVSAVLVARSVVPELLTQDAPTLWHHPDPYEAVPRLAAWRDAKLDVDRIQFRDPRQGIADLFGLPDPWPTATAWEEWDSARN